MPSLQLAPAQKEDIPALALVDEAACVGWPLAQAMEQGSTSRREMSEQWFTEAWGKDPDLRWMKVEDQESGEIAALAIWSFGDKQKAKEALERRDRDEKRSVFEEMGRRWMEFQSEFIGDQAFANLRVLFTAPKFQRQGAGSLLVKYGCDIADSKGMPCALTSSEAGLGLYSLHGFEIMQTYEMDLRPYGVEATELRRGMIRPAKKG